MLSKEHKFFVTAGCQWQDVDVSSLGTVVVDKLQSPSECDLFTMLQMSRSEGWTDALDLNEVILKGMLAAD